MKLFVPDNLLDTNENGIELIKKAESFSPVWYVCPAGVWTIGYGVTEGDGITRENTPGPITEEVGDRMFKRLLIRKYEPAVESRVGVPLTTNQFSALVSFTYNVGANALSKSRLLRKLNEGDYEGASNEFKRWVYGGGKVLGGLVKRREAERCLFMEEDPDPSEVEPLPVYKVRVLPPVLIPVNV